MKRPLWTIGLCLALGTLAAALFPLRLSLGIGAVCLILAVGAVCLPEGRHTAVPAVLFTTAAAFFLFLIYTARIVLPAKACAGGTARVTAVVQEVGSSGVTARVTGGDLPKGVRLLVITAEAPEPGQVLRGTCTLRQVSGTFHGVQLQTADPLTAEPGTGLIWTLSQWRQRLSAVYSRVNGETGEILRAMCLGDDRGLTDETTYRFRRAGTAHLLCVSGLHVSVIAAAVYGLFRRVKRLRFLSLFPAMAAVLLYMGLTGFHYAVLRAGLMQLLFLLGLALGREPDGRNSLGFALTAILLFDPAAVYDAGFWLSACATAGLLILYPAARRALKKRQKPGACPWRRRILRGAADGMLLSGCAVIAITPVTLLIFRQFTWISPLSNLFAVPAATPLVITGCLAALCGSVPALGFITAPLLAVSALCARWICGVSALFAAVPYATVTVRSPWLIAWILGGFVLTAAGWRLFRWKGVRAAAVTGAAALVCGVTLSALLMHNVTVLKVLSIGDGTAVLTKSGGQTGVVVFGGDSSAGYSLYRALAENGAEKPDWLLAADAGEENGAALLSRLAEYGAAAERVVGAGEISAAGEDGLSLQETVRAEMPEDGWLRLWIGETLWLFCPSDGDAAALPAGQRAAHMLVFDRVPPLHVTALTAQHAVFSSDSAALAGATRALPWGAIPLSLTADGDVTVYTRGRGDMVCREEGELWR